MINKLTLEHLHGSSGQVDYTRVTLTDGREQGFYMAGTKAMLLQLKTQPHREALCVLGPPNFSRETLRHHFQSVTHSI